MALYWLDGFDHFGPTNQNYPAPGGPLMLADYQTANAGLNIVASLNTSGGYALQISNLAATGLAKTGLPAVGRLIGGFRFSTNLNAVAPMWSFEIQKSAASIFSITLDGPTGKLSARTGARSGAILGTQAGALLSGSVHYLEFDVTFGASSAYVVYLDGVSIISGTGNTGNGQTTCDGFLFFAGGSGSTINVDDFYLFDSTGSVNNAPLLTSPVVLTQYPTGDAQKQWTNNGNVLVPTGIAPTGVGNTTTTVTGSTANRMSVLKFTPAVSCNVVSVGINPTGASATSKWKAVLYTDSGGVPGALIATGTEVVGCAANTGLVLPFATGQALAAGTPYWLGWIGDTNVNVSEYDTTTLLGRFTAATYTSGPPGTAPAMTTGAPTWFMWADCTGSASNWASVNGNPTTGNSYAGDAASINSATVGQEDLFSFPALPGTISNVYAVAVKAHVKKSDSGSRTIDLHTMSAGTDGTGSAGAIAPGTAYGWATSNFDTDPHTGTVWAASAVNAASHGIKIAA